MAKTFIKEFEDWLRLEMWTLDDALMILGGAIRSEIGNPSSKLIRIIDGNQKIDIAELDRVKMLWNGSIHNHDSLGVDGEKAFPKWEFLKARPMTVRPCYVVNWASKKEIGIPWLIEAEELGFRIGKPAHKEETVALVAQGGMGERKEGNLYRLIGLLKDFLTGGEENLLESQKDRKPLFKNQSELINYIDGAYGESNPGKGMKTAELKKVFAKAKQHRKDIQ